jgi:mannose-6-phosphate isomerase-like protein (cupin superfamily)
MPGFSVRLEVAEGVRETVGLWTSGGSDEGVAVLRVLMDLGQQAIDEADRLVRRGRLRSPFVIGRLLAHDDTPPLVQAMELAERSRPIELRSPFEDCESIAGGLWTAQEVFDDPREDGLAKLRFAPGTNDLPAHVHEHSDRCLYVLEGEGLFHASPGDWRTFDGTGIESVAVRAGDVVVFNRGVLHTFSAPRRELVLVSYHSPALAFDDVRQFTVPRVSWTSRFPCLPRPASTGAKTQPLP